MVLVNDKINSSSDEGEAQKKCHQKTASKEDEARQQHRNTKKSNLSSKREDNTEILLKFLIELSKKIGQRIKRTFYFVMNDLGGNQILDGLAQWCVQHPQMAICLLAAGVVAFIPILLFMAFALSTIFMTLTGFLVLEGTILTILTMIMFGLLGALGIVLLFFALVGVATYFGVSTVYDMYGSTENQRTNLRNNMQINN